MRLTILCIFLQINLASIIAIPRKSARIVGGSVTTITRWPYASSLLYSWNLATYSQACGGTIITSNALLSAAHCFYGDSGIRWRARVGSTFANSGGVVHILDAVRLHHNYNPDTYDSDVAILRTAKNIRFNTNVQPARIAGVTYSLGDNEPVWAIGWGDISFGEYSSERLQEVEVWTVNQATCRNRYAELGLTVTDNMLCSGWLDVGGRDQCQGDSGGPLTHNNVVVGVCSWGYKCGLPRYPGVNARVSRFTTWIYAGAA